MISIYENKEGTRTYEFRELLLKANIRIIEDNLFIRSIT